ncbi:MAG: glycerol-3-phosphate 1-O-acyltransferase PlsY [Opitutales bacterium]|nr:glycerol-3-phosphate 1-O-acyltransferase PlsY [Opitutales bacterium]
MTAPVAYFLIVALAAYLVGSVSFAVIISKRHGVDILKAGSGNPGATNVKRVVGKGAGNLCFVMDALKGVAAAGIPMLVFAGQGWGAQLGVTGLVAALVGHSFSVFIGFRGGKGVATTIGGLLALCPLVIIVGVIAWLAVFYASRYVSLASIALGLSLPLAAWLFSEPAIIRYFTLVLAAILIIRHRSNIARLCKGTENRFVNSPK